MRVLLMANMYPSTADPGYGSFVLRQEEILTRDHGVEFVPVVSPQRGGGLKNLPKYASLIWRTLTATLFGSYDLVHAHYLMPMAPLALLPSVLRRKPLVITAHGTDIYTGQRFPFRTPTAWALSRACAVLIVSDFLTGELIDGFGVTPRQVEIANMGVDTSLFSPGDTLEHKARRGLDPEVPHLLFIGNFVDQKGIVDLAQGLVLLASRGVRFQATLLGHGPLLGEVSRIVEPIRDMVHLAGVVPHRELVPLFRSADLFVLPSRREGVGLLVCLEALSTGVPVLAGRAGGLPEIVHPGVNGDLVEPENPRALADKIEHLLTSEGLLDTLASQARASALKHDIAEQTAVVARTYASCLDHQENSDV